VSETVVSNWDTYLESGNRWHFISIDTAIGKLSIQPIGELMRLLVE